MDKPAALSKLPISVLVISKDEHLAIERCIRSAVEAFDEVVLLDSHSADGTPELAVRAGARVIDFRWNGGYPKKKQWGLDNAALQHDWVLLLDGDEYVTPELIREIGGRILSDEFDAYDVPLSYTFLGRRLIHGHQVRKRILFRRTKAHFPVLDDLGVTNPFEMELHVQPVVRAGRCGEIDALLGHDDLEPISHWFDRHNRYSDWEAHLRSRGGVSERTKRGLLWARVPFKPLIFFIYAYVVRQGYKDGRQGFQYAIANSFYYWQIGVKEFEMRQAR